MDEMKELTDAQYWLNTSAALMPLVFPDQAAIAEEVGALSAAGHAELVDTEGAAVDAALTALAISSGAEELQRVAAALPRRVLMAMLSRWAHCNQHMQAQSLSDLRIPGMDQPPSWRAVLLSMHTDALFGVVWRGHLH